MHYLENYNCQDAQLNLMKKLSLYKNNHYRSREMLHKDNEQLSSILTVPLDKCSQLTHIKQLDRSAESMKKLFLLLEMNMT